MNPQTTSSFEFASPTRIVFGSGSVGRLGTLADQCGGRRVLLVTDPGIVRAGHVERAESSLEAQGLWVTVFDRVVENPTTRIVEDCVSWAREHNIDFIIGLGGGSSLDTAKGCNFILTGGGKMEDYWGVGRATQPMLPLIAVPTTAGTGSECQSFALISQEGTHVKMACGDPKAAARVAVLDPELTLTQPKSVAAATGMDALAHAVETAVTNKRTPLSQMLSREAFRLCTRGLPGVFSNPDDLEARGQVLLGAALAGAAIENSMLGAAHAAANPLTAEFGVIHGQAVGLMLPAVLRFNGADREARNIYHELAVDAGRATDDHDPDWSVCALAEYLEEHRELAQLPGSLAELNIHDPDLQTLAEQAAGQWTANFNPRPVTSDEFSRLYRSVVGS